MMPKQQPSTEAEFHTQLKALVRAAEVNGIDIEGGYSFRTEGEGSDWGLELFKVVKPKERDP